MKADEIIALADKIAKDNGFEDLESYHQHLVDTGEIN